MTARSRLLAGMSALLLATLIAVTADARVYRGDEDLGEAWQSYMQVRDSTEAALRFPFHHCFRRAAATHGIPETLLLAVARGESDFDPAARSHANAYGLMQILWPTTARHLGITRLADLYDPCTNVDAGTRYLKELLDRYDGNAHLALAAYNYGPGRIATNGRAIPDGAEWYSGYIYNHLGYVLGTRNPAGTGGPPAEYRDEGKMPLIYFGGPYRAQAFIKQLQASSQTLRLDWFRVEAGRYEVVLLFNGDDDYRRSVAALNQAGFSL
ncbi:MAG: lytic transglycosylase domain-containing protein [Pseudomonadota bacterium]